MLSLEDLNPYMTVMHLSLKRTLTATEGELVTEISAGLNPVEPFVTL